MISKIELSREMAENLLHCGDTASTITPYVTAELRKILAAPVVERQPVELAVWYGAMPESNGKTNWTAMLHRKGECMSEGITIDRSEYPERVLYEADRMRFLIGDLAEEPCILSYDADKHSGYVKPYTAPPELAELQAPIDRLTAENERLKGGQGEPVSVPDGWKLVPAKLTEAMADAWKKAPAGGFPDAYPSQYFGPSYIAMLAAAPSFDKVKEMNQ